MISILRRSSGSHPWYIAERHGDLAEYIRQRDLQRMPAIFRGLDAYQMLCTKGFVIPGMTNMRVMGEMVEDQVYLVVDGYKLSGLGMGMFSGRPGIHEPHEILSHDPMFELQDLKTDRMKGNEE